jgi:hypothetical protein
MAELNELDALEHAARAVDGDVAAQAPGAVAAAQEEAQASSLADNNGRMVAGVLEMAAPMIAPLYPSVAAVYTPDVCAQVGGALGPVMAKYGIDLGDWGGKYKEELTALFVCVPVALATLKAIKADVAAKQPQEQAQALGSEAVALTPTGVMKPGDYGYAESQSMA